MFFLMDILIDVIPRLFFIAFSIPISIIDLRTYKIPNSLNYACFLLLLFIRLPFMLLAYQKFVLNYFVSAILCVLGLLVIRKITKGLGLGDVKYAASIGLLCGYPLVLAALLIAALTGLVAAGIMGGLSSFHPSRSCNIIEDYLIEDCIIEEHHTNLADPGKIIRKKSRIPFAPFLSIGAIATMLPVVERFVKKF